MRRTLLCVIIMMAVSSLNAQERGLSYQFRDILFRDLVDTIERDTEMRIYYSDEWVDTLHLDISTESKTAEEFFKKVLSGEGLSFIITGRSQIILSKGFSIKTNFGEQYLEHIRRNAVKKDTVTYFSQPPAEEDGDVDDEYKVFTIGNPSGSDDGEEAVLSGIVSNPVSGEPVIGATVYVEKLKVGAVTTATGLYSLTLPKGEYQVEYRMMGMKPTIRNVIIYSRGNLDVDMFEETSQLREVVVVSDRLNRVRNVSMGVEKIDVSMLRRIPLGLGEADLIKSSLLLPGVQTVGEASAGYNVRGGSSDQNLMLLDNAPVINSSHFFGFFSAFNSDLISDVTLYKSVIPARYGGRLSSVMEIIPREGNNEKIKVSGGISPVTGRLLVNGPLKRDKSTFIIGARTTYSDWILGMLADKQLNRSTAGFYDIQGMINTIINEKNTVSLSGYYSSDRFNYYMENAFDYGNMTGNIKWKHTCNDRLSLQLSAIFSNYDYRLDMIRDSTSSNSMYYELSQKIIRADFLYFPVENHRIEMGLDATYYSLLPGVREPAGAFSAVLPKRIERERAAEPAIYLSDEVKVSDAFSFSAGLRATCFLSFGPGSEMIYYENTPRTVESIRDTVTYGRGEIKSIYPELDIRLSARMIIRPGTSLKCGVQRVFQNIHMISNTTSMSPTDIWKLSDRYIRPQMSDQFSLGLYNNSRGRAVETSVEAYYKVLNNIIDYKGGATLLMNEHLETDIISGRGKAYGVELMVKKQSGIFTGWISYTYSRVLLKTDSPYQSDKINGGEYFPANYDKPHDLKIVLNSRLSRRLNITSNFVYNTGRPVTVPVAFYDFSSTSRVYYSDRNEARIPYYMRLDLSATLNGNLKLKKLNHSSLTFTLYNVLGRPNPYSVFFRNEDGEVKGYQMSIFGQPIAMITYNFKLFGNASDDY